MHTITNRNRPVKYTVALVSALVLSAGASWAQQSTPAAAAPKPADDDTIILSPFEVSSSNNNGYAAATTLAGNRLNTQLRDIGNAVQVITSQFMKDIGATDNQTLLQYTTNTEVGNVYGNFQGSGDGATLDESPRFTNPNQNTRVRGLTAADNTRDYFLTDISWEGYNIDGVDLQRGPNSILFGQGSPAGIINTRTKQAAFKDSNEVTFRVGSFGSNRATLDVNKVLIKDELAFRFDAVRADEQYKQDPAYSKNERIYGATRWEPGFLKKGSARTIIKANIEFGEVKSNNPRNIPPIDKITPWFYTGAGNLNKIVVTPQSNVDGNTSLPDHGQSIALINGLPNPYYQPWVGNFGNQFGNPIATFNNTSGVAMAPYTVWEPRTNGGIGTNGVIDNGVGGINFQRPAGVNGYAQYAKNAKRPYSQFGLYKDKSLTDPSVFDFYNLLLDGPNKEEWQNFRAYNISFAQTFFHDHVGFDLSYNNEWFKSGQLSLLDGNGTQSIGIDMSSAYPDGLTNGLPAAGLNGTPNPNVGRPYLSSASQYTNNSYVSNRATKRATVFGRYNFEDGQRHNWFTKLLGEQTITGLAAEDNQKTDRRSWNRWGVDPAYELFIRNKNAAGNPDPSSAAIRKFNANELTPTAVIYLGPSALTAASASGLRLQNPQARMAITSGTVRTFDATWIRSTNPADPNYVNPAAPWANNYYPPSSGSNANTQSENPANYVGFRNVPIGIVDSETSAANREFLTHDAALSKSQVTSTAATWQGNFWQNAVVATYGVRKDISRAWNYTLNVNSPGTDAFGHLNLNPNSYHLASDPNNSLQITSHAWTVMTHLNQLPFLQKLPIQVSVFYNHSTDFQPAASRVDIYGEALPAPNGVTKDVGVLLETKDGKYSLKINKYENSAVNASSQALDGTWFLGSMQAWFGNWANHFEFQWDQDTAAGAHPNLSFPADGSTGAYNYGQATNPDGSPETRAQAATRQNAAVAAWRVWQKSIDPRFYKAWNINLNAPFGATATGISSSNPNGFTPTEDSVSKGYEIELNAAPTKNWRLTLNASKTTAIRTNIGGTALSNFIAAQEKALNTTAAGDLRIWWGGLGADNFALAQWNGTVGSNFALRRLQEGTNVPELREWRMNGITNYSFDHGILNGVNIGGGVRYESDIVIGYKPIPGATPTSANFDLSNPYKGPSETNFDAWVGYSRRIWRNVDWSIQLNVRNLFVGNELTPLTVQPDGSPAAYRIKPPQTWQLTNSFKF